MDKCRDKKLRYFSAAEGLPPNLMEILRKNNLLCLWNLFNAKQTVTLVSQTIIIYNPVCLG